MKIQDFTAACLTKQMMMFLMCVFLFDYFYLFFFIILFITKKKSIVSLESFIFTLNVPVFSAQKEYKIYSN